MSNKCETCMNDETLEGYPNPDCPDCKGTGKQPEEEVLLPCPFCGDMPKIIHTNPDLDGDDWTRIICCNKKCPSKTSVEYYGEGHRGMALNGWNTRTGETNE